MGYIHPTVYKLLETIHLEQSYTENAIPKINAGEGIIKKRKKYKRIDLRPKTLVGGYGQQENVTDYLRRGSSNVELNV